MSPSLPKHPFLPIGKFQIPTALMRWSGRLYTRVYMSVWQVYALAKVLEAKLMSQRQYSTHCVLLCAQGLLPYDSSNQLPWFPFFPHFFSIPLVCNPQTFADCPQSFLWGLHSHTAAAANATTSLFLGGWIGSPEPKEFYPPA